MKEKKDYYNIYEDQITLTNSLRNQLRQIMNWISMSIIKLKHHLPYTLSSSFLHPNTI